MTKEIAKVNIRHKYEERLALGKQLELLLENTENPDTEKINFFNTAIDKILTDISMIGCSCGISISEVQEIFDTAKKEGSDRMKYKAKAKIEQPNLYYEINDTIQVRVNKANYPIIQMEGEGVQFLSVDLAEMRALIDVFTEIDSILPEPEEYK